MFCEVLCRLISVTWVWCCLRLTCGTQKTGSFRLFEDKHVLERLLYSEPVPRWHIGFRYSLIVFLFLNLFLWCLHIEIAWYVCSPLTQLAEISDFDQRMALFTPSNVCKVPCLKQLKVEWKEIHEVLNSHLKLNNPVLILKLLFYSWGNKEKLHIRLFFFLFFNIAHISRHKIWKHIFLQNWPPSDSSNLFW